VEEARADYAYFVGEINTL